MKEHPSPACAYLKAAKKAIQTLFDQQTAPWGGNPEGPLCVVKSRITYKGCRIIGAKPVDTYISFELVEPVLEQEPFRLDMQAWPVLDLFSELSGDPAPRQCAKVAAQKFAQSGFDPVSGLPYLGEIADFDVLKLAPVAVNAGGDDFWFKQTDDVPLDHLWAAAPQAMARMFHSIFYGLIQRPETMDYNRFCEYGFDDSKKKPCREFHSNHCATAYAGAYMIHWWGYYHARSGDKESLQWAQAMTEKWRKAQHSESGLLPGWFGSHRTDEDHMPPLPYCNNWDGGTAISYFRAANEWKKRPEGQELAEKLEDMGLKLITGMARYGFDAKTRTFPQWINVDGSRREETGRYTFYSQEEREEQAKKDPRLAEVYVMASSGFYESIRPWILAAGNPLPYNVALAAKMTGNPYLLDRAREFAELVMEEAKKLNGEFNAGGQWMITANASYIKMHLVLFEITGNKKYLQWAKELADLELGLLSQPLPEGKLEWWRMYFRNVWIEALLLLHQADSKA